MVLASNKKHHLSIIIKYPLFISSSGLLDGSLWYLSKITENMSIQKYRKYVKSKITSKYVNPKLPQICKNQFQTFSYKMGFSLPKQS